MITQQGKVLSKRMHKTHDSGQREKGCGIHAASQRKIFFTEYIQPGRRVHIKFLWQCLGLNLSPQPKASWNGGKHTSASASKYSLHKLTQIIATMFNKQPRLPSKLIPVKNFKICAKCVAQVGDLWKRCVGKTLSAVTTTGTLSLESTLVAGEAESGDGSLRHGRNFIYLLVPSSSPSPFSRSSPHSTILHLKG